MYVSKTKMGELTAEFPPGFWSRLSPTAGLEIPPVKLDVGIKGRPERPSATRARIERMLRKQGKLGSVDDPPDAAGNKYVTGNLNMRWGIHDDVLPSIVWFMGSTDRTLVALGGRARHLTGVTPMNCLAKHPRQQSSKMRKS